jgi:hypothetical protein
MPRNSQIKLMVVSLLVVLANAFDLLSTWIASPDLANEWNVLHRHLGWGWAGLFGAKAVGATLAILGYAYYLRHRDACYPQPGLDRSAFCRYFSFGRQASWIEMQAGIPMGRTLGVNLGYFWTGMQALVVWVAVDNLLLKAGFVWGIRYWSEMGYHMLQSLIIAAGVITRLYAGNYARYVRASELGAAVVVAGPAGEVVAAQG